MQNNGYWDINARRKFNLNYFFNKYIPSDFVEDVVVKIPWNRFALTNKKGNVYCATNGNEYDDSHCILDSQTTIEECNSIWKLVFHQTPNEQGFEVEATPYNECKFRVSKYADFIVYNPESRKIEKYAKDVEILYNKTMDLLNKEVKNPNTNSECSRAESIAYSIMKGTVLYPMGGINYKG